jgi:cell division protein FtsI (penicillin-binding protein 3)
MITAATALANGGVLLRPRIVARVVSPDGSTVKEYPREPVREVLSPKTAETLLAMMEQAVASPEGTVRRARVPGLRISAKSGTAQIADPETGTYSEDRFLSSVLAIFPTEDPRLIVYVVLENPKGFSYYGGRIASPVVKEIATVLSPYFGIPVGGNRVVSHPGTVRITRPEPEPLGEVLPDLTGYSKRMLLPYLTREGMSWSVNGEGWVVFQFPPPGTPIEPGMSVYVVLE